PGGVKDVDKVRATSGAGEVKWTFEVMAQHVDLTGTANPITIRFGIGDDRGSQTLLFTVGQRDHRTEFTFPPGRVIAVCGNGTVEGNEACDDGDLNSDTTPDACRTTCTRPRCGDGVVDSGEACDPPGPGCSDDCRRQGCTPSPEVCDGIDNDCNGQVDEGLGRTTCGVGACTRTVDSCVGGVPQRCTPGTPSPEVCDGIDNDCNGQVDDGLGRTTCGVGACTRTVDSCVGGVPQPCTPGTPSPEVCDGIDNDCNGQVDEGLDRAPVTVEIATPANGFLTNQGSVRVTGAVSATAVSVQVNGVEAVLEAGGFTADGVPL